MFDRVSPRIVSSAIGMVRAKKRLGPEVPGQVMGKMERRTRRTDAMADNGGSKDSWGQREGSHSLEGEAGGLEVGGTTVMSVRRGTGASP